MKVLVLSHSSAMGGAERSMLDLFDYWQREKGLKPHFIVRLPHKELVPQLKRRGWSYISLRYDNWSTRRVSPPRQEDKFWAAVHNTKAVTDIENLIKEYKPDVVMTNTLVAPWAAIAAYFQKVPHIWFVREYGDIDHQHAFELGKQKTFQDIGTLSSLVVTNSKTLAKYVGEFINPKKLTTLYTPFNLEAVASRAAQKANNPFKDPSSLKLVITGRVAPSKGQALAAEAVGRLGREGYNLELCVIGTPDQPHEADTLRAIIKKYGLDTKVHLVGHQENPLAILALADVGIMASAREAFGRVTFEYMATGRAVVGSDSGATPELVDHGKTGYLYKPGDPASLAAQLRRYAKDKNLAAEHGRQAKLKAMAMMGGSFTAEALYKKVQAVAAIGPDQLPKPINYSRRWLHYPKLAVDYIEESGVLSLKRVTLRKVRKRLSRIYNRLKNRLPL